MQLHDNCIILLPDHKRPVQPPIKTRGLRVLHAPHSSSALCCLYMAPKCLFYCLMGKLLTTTAGLMANDLERCDMRYCGKALQKVEVVEMMPRFFWRQQNSLLWAGIYILSVPRSFDCQGIWNRASEAHEVMYQKKKKM